jgi:PleD family two-component response regulator
LHSRFRVKLTATGENRRVAAEKQVGNVRLLVVEDEARIAEILRSALSRSGFAVDAVGRCGDARAPWRSTPTMPSSSIWVCRTATG